MGTSALRDYTRGQEIFEVTLSNSVENLIQEQLRNKNFCEVKFGNLLKALEGPLRN